MAEGVEYKIGLNVSTALAAVGKLVSATGGLKTALGGLAGAGAKAFGGLSDVLFKLPSQVQSLQGAFAGLTLPSRLAGSMETTAVAFRVLVGDALKAKGVLDEIKAMAAETPFEFPELAGAARTLAALGEDAQAIPAVLRRIGDVAAGTETSVRDLAEIYGKARVAGTLFAQDINELTGRGIPIIQEFAKQLGVSEGAVKKLAAEGKITFPMLEAAFAALTGKGGAFYNMMAEISQTFEGKMSTLSGSVNDLLSAMGAGINEGIKPVLDELTRQLDGQQGMAKSIGEAIGYGVEVGLEVIQSGQAAAVLKERLDYAAASFLNEMLRALSILGVKIHGLAVDALGVAGNALGQVSDEKLAEGKAIVERKVNASVAEKLAGDGPQGDLVKEQKAQLDAALKPATKTVEKKRQTRATAEVAKQEEAAENKEERERLAAIDAEQAAELAEMNRLQDIDMDEARMNDNVRAGRSPYDDGTAAPPAAAPPAAAPPAAAPPAAAPPAAGRGRAMPGYAGPTREQALSERRAVAGEGRPEDAGRKIMGALFPRGAASGLGAGNMYRQYGAEAERRGASDRLKAGAGAAAADPRAAAAEKALALLEKHLPEMARTLKQAVEE